jgi:ubiquinone/menaquinone biosynthesis C-methylase UbiE
MNVTPVIEKWCSDILVDPLAKDKIFSIERQLKTQYGLSFPVCENGVPDLRIRFRQTEDKWLQGQSHYEAYMQSYYAEGEINPEIYSKIIKSDALIYDKININGRCLDVGGQLGTVRIFMEASQEYCSIDPFLTVFDLVQDKHHFIESFNLNRTINFIGGFAEFLPFQSLSFDTVHMRSCIDHFFNPEIALLEAFRVLKFEGKLIIGIHVETKSRKNAIKDTVKSILSIITDKFHDHHMYHPTYESLCRMVEKCGFSLTNEFWQREDVVYLEFKKMTNFLMKQ